jgi:hypothetical protein
MVNANREALGLSSMKPSEMIEGLDKVAERAEAMEAREEEKRRGGGNISANAALHVDETGAKWSRQVLFGIVGVVAVVGIAVSIMIYLANHKETSPREANEESRQRLAELRVIAQQMPLFGADEDVSLDKIRERLNKKLDDDLKDIETQIESTKASKRPVEERDSRKRRDLLELKDLKDGWGQPMELSMPDSDTLQITVKPGKGASDALTPVTVRIRKKK